MAALPDRYRQPPLVQIATLRGGPQDGLWLHLSSDRIPNTVSFDGHSYSINGSEFHDEANPCPELYYDYDSHGG